MDGIDYFRSPHPSASVCEADEWRRCLRQTAACVVVVLGVVIGLDAIGVHFPVVTEYPSDPPPVAGSPV